ncbi:MAG TPA: hypothetical protein VFS68_04370 [Candidatus Udaeobacter sp.]|nr:hypothetical protein [Candidatus Udaeobacter sp.]
MPQSVHVLSAHIIFSTKQRQPWLPPTIRKRVWAYQSRILQGKYILDQDQHHRKETFQEEYLRILKKYRAPYDERYLWD